MFCVQFDWPMYMQIMGLVLCVPRVCNEQQPAVALKVVIVLE